MDPCVKLAREFKRADRAAACASPKDSAYKDRQRATAERAAHRLVRTPPMTPQGAARLLDYAAWLSGETFGEDTPEVLRQIGRHWRNGRRVVDEFAVLLQIIELVELLPRDTLLSEGARKTTFCRCWTTHSNLCTASRSVQDALAFRSPAHVTGVAPMPPLRNLKTERQMAMIHTFVYRDDTIYTTEAGEMQRLFDGHEGHRIRALPDHEVSAMAATPAPMQEPAAVDRKQLH